MLEGIFEFFGMLLCELGTSIEINNKKENDALVSKTEEVKRE